MLTVTYFNILANNPELYRDPPVIESVPLPTMFNIQPLQSGIKRKHYSKYVFSVKVFYVMKKCFHQLN